MGIGLGVLIEPEGLAVQHAGHVTRSEMIVSFTVRTDVVLAGLAVVDACTTEVTSTVQGRVC